MKYIDPQLYKQVKNVLDINKAQRHIRGGLATRKKYQEAHEAAELAKKVSADFS